MKVVTRMVVAGVWTALAVSSALAQQSSNPVQGNAGQASQPAAASSGPGSADTTLPATRQSTNPESAPSPTAPTKTGSSNSTAPSTEANVDDNPYDPILEPPPLPKGKATLIGGHATSVDHVRNRMTVQPFGGGTKIKVFIDERSHVYRNGAETTVLGIHKGDRVYVDTMLDGSRVLAKNVRVLTQSGLAEVRGQVVAVNPDKGTISVRDQLSSKPVAFQVSGATRYSSSKGSATAADVQTGSLIDVQFSPRRDDKVVAQEIMVLAKPGDDYVFSGVVTNLDMRSSSFSVQNRSDDQPYEVHFVPAAVSDPQALKVGSEVTTHATFDGKQYKASNVRIEKPAEEEGDQSKVQ